MIDVSTDGNPRRKQSYRSQDSLVTTDAERIASLELLKIMESRGQAYLAQQCMLVSTSTGSDGTDALQRVKTLLMQVPPFVLVHKLVLRLSMDSQGCRLLQDALEECSSEQRKELAAEMRGHVRAASESPHANFVVQRFIELLPPAALNFVMPELVGDWDSAAMARHMYGCRVLQRLLEHFTACSQAREALFHFVEADALREVGQLCFHRFGNFVAQNLFEHGSLHQKQKIWMALRGNLRKVASHEFAASVLYNALTYMSRVEQQSLAAELLRIDDLFQPEWITSREGQVVIERLLCVLNENGPARLDLIGKLRGHYDTLMSSRGGRNMLAKVRELMM